MIDSQQLQVFVTLARLLNLSRAAAQLHLTPSGVSRCLKSLETDLGCRLFHRSPQSVQLTIAGQKLLPEAHAILERMQVARHKVTASKDWRKGQLRCATNSTACQYILPLVFREFRESFSDYTIKLHVASMQGVLELLSHQEVDLALTFEPKTHPGLNFIPLVEEQFKLIVNPLHPWVLHPKAPRGSIAEQNLIIPERGSETYRLIEAYFQHDGIHIPPFIELENEEAIKQFIRLNLGVGILPAWIADMEVRQGILRALPLGRRKLTRRWGILVAKNRSLTFAENLFAGICRSVATNLVAHEAHYHEFRAN